MQPSWLALVLNQLQPGVLKSLRLGCSVDSGYLHRHSPMDVALCVFAGLTELHMTSETSPPLSPPALASLQQLRHLSVSAASLPLRLVQAAAELTQLTELRLESTRAAIVADSPSWRQVPGPGKALSLSQLSQLCCLELINHSHPDGSNTLLVPPPTCFPHLRRHSLEHCDVRHLAVLARHVAVCAP